MTVVVDTRTDFTLENFRRVALEGESVRIGPRALERMESTRNSFVALLDSDRTQFIYGTTTRAGIEVGKALAPDEQRGHVVLAYVVASEPVSAGDLQDHVKASIAPYKYPRRIEFVDELPRTPTGKVQRNVLRERA